MESLFNRLKTILQKMDVPAKRVTDLENPVNLRWLSRNIIACGKGHKDLKTAQGLIKSLLKNSGK